MPDKREEILNSEHWKSVEDSGMQCINTKHFPLAYKETAINAMDEYATSMCLDLLEYMAKNNVDCAMWEDGPKFLVNQEYLSKQQLFENFL